MEKNADITVYFNTLQHIKEQITKNVVKKIPRFRIDENSTLHYGFLDTTCIA